MFCPRQLFRALNRCRPRWLSTAQHDSSNRLHDPQSNTVIQQQQSAHTNTTMQMMAAANSGNLPVVFKIAAKMKANGIAPDISTYNALMHATAQDANALFSWAVLDDMLLFGVQPTTTTFTHLIEAQRTRPSRYLWHAWDKMRELSIKPNAQIYTSVIKAFIRNENLEMAIQYLFAMKSQNIVPELSAVQAVIVLAAENGYPRLALDLAAYFEGISPRRLGDVAWIACLYSAAQAFYMDGVFRCWTMAVNELDIAPDEGVCMSVINAAARHGNPDLVTDVLRVLKRSGIAWKEYHFAALIEAFCRNDQLKQALITLHIMRSNEIVPLPGTAAFILDFVKVDVESLDKAWTVIDEIHEAKSGVDIDALKIIIRASVFLVDLQRAVGVYKSLPDYGLAPDLSIFNTLFDGCITARHRQLGDLLLADMKELKIQPDEETYEKMIRLCLTQEVYEDAFFYLEEMKAAGFVAPRTVYEALVLKCHSTGDTRKEIALEEMRECGYTMSTPNTREEDSTPFIKGDPEMPTGLNEDTLEYIKTGGLSRGRHS